ncbi:MAG: hypothetical protein DHS20C10_03650 [marine bacterium B5-7]|nr:MAG: hypothetical protein DHS20C10_03650 [marine bacterium B5-7]
MKSFHRTLAFSFGLLLANLSIATPTAQFMPVLAHTELQAVSGNPSILLLVKNLDTQQIQPFFFVIDKPNSNVMFNLNTRKYQVLSAQLQTNHGTVNDFCHIRKEVLTNQDIVFRLKGKITDNTKQYTCHAQYQQHA